MSVPVGAGHKNICEMSKKCILQCGNGNKARLHSILSSCDGFATILREFMDHPLLAVPQKMHLSMNTMQHEYILGYF